VKGKYAYLQPEVLKGHTPDRRSDIWGMGVVLWELLTGCRLFDYANDVDALRAIAEMEIPPPSKVRQGLRPELDEIVLKALQRDPAKRDQTARELGRRLTGFLAEHRLAIGVAEVADGMDRLFPSGRRCKQQLLDVVDEIDPVDVDLDDDPEFEPATVAASAPMPARRAAVVPQPRKTAAPPPPVPAPTPIPPPPVRAGLGAVFGAAGAAAIVALALGAFVGRRAWSSPAVAPAEPAAKRPAATTVAAADRNYLLDVAPVETTEDGVLLRLRMVPGEPSSCPE
jgi:serine/threonine-protein kinase